MAGLGPAIHVFLARIEFEKTWVAGPSPAMTSGMVRC